MLEYTAQDIIDRAEQYANKENSSVYSFTEKVSMLNEAWHELYQTVINTGDKFWINSFTFTGKSHELPKDLYELATVKKDDDVTSKYEIINNEIIFKEEGKYEIEYYPNPKTLSFKQKMKKSPYQVEGFKAAKNGLFLRSVIETETDEDDNEVTTKSSVIYNSVSKTENTIPNFIPSDYMAFYDNGILAFDETNNLYSFTNKTITTITLPVIYKNTVYKYKVDTEEVIDPVTGETKIINHPAVYDGNVKIADCIEASEDTKAIVTSDLKFFIEINGYCPKSHNDGFLYIKDNQLHFTEVEVPVIEIEEPVETVIIDRIISSQFTPVGYDEDMLITYDSLSEIFFDESIYENTTINYPSNIYITILALSIAMKMRAKQGIENEKLDQQYQLAIGNLYNTLDRDKNKCFVIKDVYMNKRYNSIFN